MPLSALHVTSIPTERGSNRCFQLAQVLLPGRHRPVNVNGSNFISNLIDRHNASAAGGSGFTPRVLLSPLNYPRALDWRVTAFYFPGASYFSLTEFLAYNQPDWVFCSVWLPCVTDPGVLFFPSVSALVLKSGSWWPMGWIWPWHSHMELVLRIFKYLFANILTP